MDKKLTDSEIVKACKDCLHYEACKGTYSSAKGDEDILYDFDGEMYANSGCEDFEDKNLINRLQAENKRLSTLAELGNTRANDYRVMRDRALKAEAEVERLKKEKDEYTYLYEKHINTAFSHIKAEAYKEFAERLKEKSDSRFDYSELFFEISEEDIDNLIKEMVGESNV